MRTVSIAGRESNSMRVVLIGRGRMGGAIARAFREARVPFVTVSGRGGARAWRRVRRSRDGVVWILAVTDAAVVETSEALSREGLLRAGDAVVHLAGMLGPEALDAAKHAGARVGALHPLVAVADPRDPPSFARAALSFEGDAALARTVRELFEPTGASVHRIAGVDRARYHAAAALSATGAVAIAQGTAALLRRAARGLDEKAIRAFARSLVASAAHNVYAAGPSRALASPLMRGDTRAIARHLESMRVAPQARALYAAALRQVLETLEHERAVDPKVIREGRRLARSATSERSSRRRKKN
jgi:predicted short-subunit dehydrogenase-like oxidoreductase (DUF2520 family)